MSGIISHGNRRVVRSARLLEIPSAQVFHVRLSCHASLRPAPLPTLESSKARRTEKGVVRKVADAWTARSRKAVLAGLEGERSISHDFGGRWNIRDLGTFEPDSARPRVVARPRSLLGYMPAVSPVAPPGKSHYDASKTLSDY